MTPEERIAAALLKADDRAATYDASYWAEVGEDAEVIAAEDARAILAADPTIAADLALAAAVRRYKFFFTGDDVRASLKLLGPTGTKGEGTVKIAAEFGADIMDALR